MESVMKVVEVVLKDITVTIKPFVVYVTRKMPELGEDVVKDVTFRFEALVADAIANQYAVRLSEKHEVVVDGEKIMLNVEVDKENKVVRVTVEVRETVVNATFELPQK